jgi:hypothetical protein
MSRFIYGEIIDMADVMLTPDLDSDVINEIRCFFAYRSGYFGVEFFHRQMRAMHDHFWISDRSVTTLKNNLYRIVSGSKLDPNHVRRLTFVPLCGFQNGSDVRLWTLSPIDYRHRPGSLYKHMVKKRTEMDDYQTNRHMFKECVEEIDNEVAYRPGMYKMEDAQHHFLSLVESMQ